MPSPDPDIFWRKKASRDENVCRIPARNGCKPPRRPVLRSSESPFQRVGSGRAGGVSPLSGAAEDRGLTPPARPFGTDSERRPNHPAYSTQLSQVSIPALLA